MIVIDRARQNVARMAARRPDNRGFSLVELMAATILIIVVVFTLGDVYSRTRRLGLAQHEWRMASAVARGQMDRLRSEYTYAALPTLSDTTVTADGHAFQVGYDTTDGPDSNMVTIRVEVSWQSWNLGGEPRSTSCQTIIGEHW